MTGLTGGSFFFLHRKLWFECDRTHGRVNFFWHRKLWFECDRTHRMANFFGIESCGLNVT